MYITRRAHTLLALEKFYLDWEEEEEEDSGISCARVVSLKRVQRQSRLGEASHREGSSRGIRCVFSDL